MRRPSVDVCKIPIYCRLNFNEKFLELRALKISIINNIKLKNIRIREINEDLDQIELSLDLWEPNIDPREFPDDRDEVTLHELIEYRKLRFPGSNGNITGEVYSSSQMKTEVE